jgi:DNA-binding XRE family transcriptional regulator
LCDPAYRDAEFQIVRYFSQIEHFCLKYQNMRAKRPSLLPTSEKLLQNFGENLQLARKRRKLTGEQMAARAGIARSTLWLIEKGDPGVAIGNYVQILFVLGLQDDLEKLAADDILGRKLQDAKLISSTRSSGIKRVSK